MRTPNLLYPSDRRLRKRTEALLASVPAPLSPWEADFLELLSWKVSKYCRGGRFRFLAAAWALVFLGKIPGDSPLFTRQEASDLAALRRMFDMENSGDWRGFLAELFATEYGLFRFQTVFKYVMVSQEGRYGRLVPDWKNYKRVIGHAYLVVLNAMGLSKIEGIFQDVYFREFHPKEYAEMVRRTRLFASGMSSHFFTVNVVNEMSDMMREARAWGAVNVRFKSYFSIYNKIIRKGLEHVMDVIGLRIVFPDIRSLRRFSRLFEGRIFVSQKKDYVAQPKPNGYRSVHYKFFYNHLQVASYVELQVRTRAMDEAISKQDVLSGLSYAIREKKYHPKFKEIHQGLAEMARLVGPKEGQEREE